MLKLIQQKTFRRIAKLKKKKQKKKNRALRDSKHNWKISVTSPFLVRLGPSHFSGLMQICSSGRKKGEEGSGVIYDTD